MDHFYSTAFYRAHLRPSTLVFQGAQDAQHHQGRFDEVTSNCRPKRLWSHLRRYCHVRARWRKLHSRHQGIRACRVCHPQPSN